jgi:hypothetical protein
LKQEYRSLKGKIDCTQEFDKNEVSTVVRVLIVLVTEGGKGNLICKEPSTEGGNKYLEGYIDSIRTITANEGDKPTGEDFVS